MSQGVENVTGNDNTEKQAALVDAGNNIVTQAIAMFRDWSSRRWQEKMWEKQNEYNLPVNQRKRLEAAGLNPNLMFGSSANAMGTNVPSSPTTHVPQTDFGERYLRFRQVDSDIRKQNADTRRQNEETRRLENSNLIIESLLNDTIETKKGQMYIDRIWQGWMEDHQREMLDLGLTESQLRNDLLSAQRLYTMARTGVAGQELVSAIQLYNHLEKKYGYEDQYYDAGINPYETSTPIGFIRSIVGLAGKMLDINPNYFDLPGLHYDRNTGQYVPKKLD